MPYRLSTKKVKGKKKWCMTNKETGKTYCYDRKEAREKAMQIHEAYAHGWKPSKRKK